jgi:hypothetical protein
LFESDVVVTFAISAAGNFADESKYLMPLEINCIAIAKIHLAEPLQPKATEHIRRSNQNVCPLHSKKIYSYLFKFEHKDTSETFYYT